MFDIIDTRIEYDGVYINKIFSAGTAIAFFKDAPSPRLSRKNCLKKFKFHNLNTKKFLKKKFENFCKKKIKISKNVP